MEPCTEPVRDDDEALLVAEAQLLLSEKRTSLSTIRTGIAVTAIPLSIVSILIATSKLYDAATMAHLLVPLLVACGLLFALGVYPIAAEAATEGRRVVAARRPEWPRPLYLPGPSGLRIVASRDDSPACGLMVRALLQLRRYDRLVQDLRARNTRVRELLS